MRELEVVERKVLGALMILSEEDGRVKASHNEIAEKMGYKKSGGTITYALRSLQRDNIIHKISSGRYQILI